MSVEIIALPSNHTPITTERPRQLAKTAPRSMCRRILFSPQPATDEYGGIQDGLSISRRRSDRCLGSYLHNVDTFIQIDRAEFVAGFRSDPAVVVLNPDDQITPEPFTAWPDHRQAGNRSSPGCALLTPSPKPAPLARCEPGR